MKKLVLLCLCLMLALFFCACGEKKSPYYDYYPPTNDTDTTPDSTTGNLDTTDDNIPDIPNIDHEILDADRHLGNTPENYSSEETMLVEYGNRIYHCYNDERQIMEYCTENGKTKALGIYGTDLSVYKNVLYYIDSEEHDIHAYDLATGTDSVWINRKEVARKIPDEIYSYGWFSNLIVSDYGMFFLFEVSFRQFVHVDFDKNVQAFLTFERPGCHNMVALGDDCIAIASVLGENGMFYTPSTASYTTSPLKELLTNISYFSPGKLFYNDFENSRLLGFDTSTMTNFEIFEYSVPTELNGRQYKYQDLFIYYSSEYKSTPPMTWKTDLSNNTSVNLGFNRFLYSVTFTSDGAIYGIACKTFGDEKEFFKTDTDFKNITYLN